MKIIQEECRGCSSLTRKTNVYGLQHLIEESGKEYDIDTVAENIKNNKILREAIKTYICSFEIEVESIEKLYEDCPCQNCIVKTLCATGCDIFSKHVHHNNRKIKVRGK